MTCAECERLEREYRRAISQIYAIVDCRYAASADKIPALRLAQGWRDIAVTNLYEHKKSPHIRKKTDQQEQERAA